MMLFRFLDIRLVLRCSENIEHLAFHWKEVGEEIFVLGIVLFTIPLNRLRTLNSRMLNPMTNFSWDALNDLNYYVTVLNVFDFPILMLEESEKKVDPRCPLHQLVIFRLLIWFYEHLLKILIVSFLDHRHSDRNLSWSMVCMVCRCWCYMAVWVFLPPLQLSFFVIS